MGQQGPHRRWHVLAVMVVCLLVIVLDNTVLNVALRTLAEPRAGLGASQSQLEWAVNSYTLVFAGLLLTAGVIGDKLGRKRVLATGLAWFATASLLCAYARSPDQLIAARAAMGLGGALIMPQTLSIITNVFEPEERPRAIAIWSAAVGLAVAIGPVTGGLLLSRFWWGSVFLINVPIVTAGLTGVIWFVPESRNPCPGKLDASGVLLSIAGLVSLSYGVIQGGGTGHWASFGALAPLTAGLVLLALFTWRESRIKNPVLNVRLFRDARLCCAVAAIVLVFFSLSGVLFVTSFYLQNVRNYSPLRAGLVMLPFAAGQLIFAPRSAIMVAKFGAKNVCTAGLLLVAAAYSGYELMGAATPVWVLGMIFFVLGAGLVHILPPANECLMAALPREQAGSGSGINSTARQIAEALGVAVLGSILTAGYRPGSPAPGVPLARATDLRHRVDRRDHGRRPASRCSGRPASGSGSHGVHQRDAYHASGGGRGSRVRCCSGTGLDAGGAAPRSRGPQARGRRCAGRDPGRLRHRPARTSRTTSR